MLCFASLLSAFAGNEKGVVCLKIRGCDYIVVCLQSGYYTITEDSWDKCEEGDVLVGDFKSYGYKEVYNLTKDKNMKLYNDDYYYSEKMAVEKWKNKCNR